MFMKKIGLLLIAMVFTGSAFAQTGNVPSKKPQPGVQPGTSQYPQQVSPAQPTLPDQSTMPSQSSPSNTQSVSPPLPPMQSPRLPASNDQSYLNDMILIEYDQLPALLQRSLQNDQYIGWQNSNIYQNKVTKEYSILIPHSDSDSVKAYRFNRDGKSIDDK